MIDRIADYRARVAEHAVMPGVEPGAIRSQLPGSPPDAGEPFDAIMTDVDRIIMPGLMHWQHPSFFGFFPSNGALASVLGDFLSTGLGVIGLSWQSSPALTELEEVMADWLRQMMGLDAEWAGVIQDTASTSSLIALLCARERATGASADRGGLQAEPRPLTVYITAYANSSVAKAALLAGFGRDNVRVVPVDASFAMDADALRRMMADDAARGMVPCAVVATTGTTATTALDPVADIVGIAREHAAWVHVDAAMAGSAMILPECRWMWAGIDGADSLVVNAHKWLGAAFDCSLYYVRNPDQLVQVMSTSPTYLRSSADAAVRNYRDWGIPLGRRFRALKLWCLIREQGVAALQARIRRDIENARWLADRIAATPDWQVITAVPLQTVCVRHVPGDVSPDELDHHTRAWAERINRSGKAYLTSAVIGGRWTVRISIGAEMTERPHVEALWTLMQEAVATRGATVAATREPS